MRRGNPNGRRPATNAEHVTRLMSKVDITPTGCWEYQGQCDPKGYGRFSMGRAKVLAHRAAWILRHGPIADGLMVCHHCDNPPCVNPAHLFLGTAADNNADRHAKGRTRNGVLHGEAHGRAVLTEADVRTIRSLGGVVKQRDLADRFGVSQSAIQRAMSGDGWRHLAGAR